MSLALNTVLSTLQLNKLQLQVLCLKIQCFFYGLDHLHSSFDSDLQKFGVAIDSLLANPSYLDQILNISAHKRKSIISTLLKLPIVTVRGYIIQNIKIGFTLNVHLDTETKLVPSIDNIVDTYNGTISGLCLKVKKDLMLVINIVIKENGTITQSSIR